MFQRLGSFEYTPKHDSWLNLAEPLSSASASRMRSCARSGRLVARCSTDRQHREIAAYSGVPTA